MKFTRALTVVVTILMVSSVFASVPVTGESANNVVGVETQEATRITEASAWLHGNITYLNDSVESADVSFKYWEEGTPSNNSTIEVGDVDSTSEFQAHVTGLSNNTTYVYKAIAEANGTSVNGSVETFTTAKEEILLEVETRPASNVTNTSATLNGNLTELDENATETVVWFQYWEKGDKSTKSATPAINVSQIGTFSTDVGNLSSKTDYVYRAHAKTNDTEIDYVADDRGSELDFRTESDNLEVETLDASDVTNSSATLNGQLAGLGNFSNANVSFTYWIQSDPANQTSMQAGSLEEPGTFYYEVTGLQNNTTYVYRAEAEANGQSTIGDNVTFQTGVEDELPTFTGDGPFGLWLAGIIHEHQGSEAVDGPFGQWVSDLVHANNPSNADREVTGPPEFVEDNETDEEDDVNETQRGPPDHATDHTNSTDAGDSDDPEETDEETAEGGSDNETDRGSGKDNKPDDTPGNASSGNAEGNDDKQQDDNPGKSGEKGDQERGNQGNGNDDKPGQANDKNDQSEGDEDESDDEESEEEGDASDGQGSEGDDVEDSEDENEESDDDHPGNGQPPGHSNGK